MRSNRLLVARTAASHLCLKPLLYSPWLFTHSRLWIERLAGSAEQLRLWLSHETRQPLSLHASPALLVESVTARADGDGVVP